MDFSAPPLPPPHVGTLGGGLRVPLLELHWEWLLYAGSHVDGRDYGQSYGNPVEAYISFPPEATSKRTFPKFPP